MLSASWGFSRAARVQPLITQLKQLGNLATHLLRCSCHSIALETRQPCSCSEKGYRTPAATSTSTPLHMNVPPMQEQPPAATTTVSPSAPAATQTGWSHPMMSYYLNAGRNWKAVEDYYIRLVSGAACLSDIGLAPAGAAALEQPAAVAAYKARPVVPEAAAEALRASEQVALQEQQQVQQLSSAQQQNARRTYKVYVSYLGSSFAGWARQPGRLSVEGTLAAAVAAAGLTGESPDDHNARRAAARATRRRLKRANTTAETTATEEPCVRVSAVAGAAQSGAANNTTAAGIHMGAACDDSAAAGDPGDADALDLATAIAPTSSSSIAVRLPAISVAGRTDLGVTAVGQVISFHSRLPPMQPHQLLQQLNAALAAVLSAEAAAPTNSSGNSGKSLTAPVDNSSSQLGVALALPIGNQIRVWAACEESRQFHATFSATWRRYVYLLPFRHQQKQQVSDDQPGLTALASSQLLPHFHNEITPALDGALVSSLEQSAVQQAPDINAETVNALLKHLQGHKLDYYSYGRDTPKDKNCECILHTARASVVHLPLYAAVQASDHQGIAGAGRVDANNGQNNVAAVQPCLCIELVGDRFLRRMVRVLVATAVRESLAAVSSHYDVHAAEAPVQSLVKLAALADRNITAAPAPALGLCFAAAGYEQ